MSTPGMSQGFCQGCTRSRDESKDTADRAFNSSIVTNTDTYREGGSERVRGKIRRRGCAC